MATGLAEHSPLTKTKYDAKLEQELGKVAGKIRFHDFLTGVLILAVLGFGYAAAGVLLDRTFELNLLTRQIALAGFASFFLASAYLLVLRPFLRVVNPRYSARQIEGTMDDAKNALINWVDLQDRTMPDAVRNAVGAKAAAGVAEADVNKVGESKRLLWLGGAAGLLVMALAVMFLVFKPAPFSSLVKRTFLPFNDIAIASRTTVTVIEPEGGDVTVTTGDSLVVKVDASGSIPEVDSPDRIRLLLRHNPESAEYEAIPLEREDGTGLWVARLNQSVIQNGFWYRAAGGDSQTPEYRVSVRTKPLIKAYEVHYAYPPYTRLKPEQTRESNLSAYRGTRVTLIATTNRTVRKGWLTINSGDDSVSATVIGEKRDQIRFEFPLTASGSYRIGFTPESGEVAELSAPHPILVLVDQPPRPEITTVQDPAKPVPANGVLAVDGIVGDDFGVDKLTLRMKYYDGAVSQELQAKPYLKGASFRRIPDPTKPDESDYPTSVTYKDSVLLGEVKGKAGQPVTLSAGMEIEYWLEATDNCTEPKANVGKSAPRRIKLGESLKTPEQIREEQNARKAEEEKHRSKQDQQLKTEKRDPPAQPRPEQVDPPKGSENPENPPKPDPNKPDPMPPMKGGSEKPPEGGKPDPSKAGDPMGTQPGDDPEKVKAEAQKVEQAIQDQNRKPGEARNGDDTKPDPMTKPAEPKAAPPEQGTQPKEGDPKENPTEPKGETKGAGTAEQPKPSDPKTPPETMGNETPKQEPKASDAPQEKTAPKDPKGTPEQDPGAAREKDPNANEGSPKGRPEATPGVEKPTPKPGDEKAPPEQQPGEAKPEKPTDPGAAKQPGAKKPEETGSKPAPTEPEATKPKSGANDPMQPKGDPGQEKPSNGQQGEERPSGKNDLSKNVNDLGSDDPKKRQEARDNLDKTVGQKERERYERIAEDLKSGDKDRVEKAQKELGELEREQGEKSNDKSNFPPRQSDVDRLQRDAEKLDSQDPNERSKAEDEFKDKLEKKDQQKLKDAAKDLKSNDPAKREQAKKDVDELTKKAAKNDANKQPTKEQSEDLAKKAPDLAADDSQKREAAEKEFDEKVGRQNREQIQKDMKDLKSKDAETSKAAQERIEKAAEKAAQNGKPPTKEEIEQAKKNLQDLNSPDKDKREAAEKKVDEKLGKAGREQLQKDVKDLQSGDPMKEKAAQERIQKAAEDAAKKDPMGGKPPTKEEIEQAKKDLQDLNSSDKDKREAAEKKVDEKLGKADREQLQKDMKDLQSGDPMKEKAAQERIQKAAEDTAKKDPMGGKSPTKEEIEQAKKDLQDLNSPDKDKREAAEKKVDEKLGKTDREQLQKDMKDLQSGDPKKQEEAKKRLEEMAKKTGKPGGEPSQKAADELKNQAEDLTSNDPGKREAAEKKLDEQLGKPAREELQKNMDDLNSKDPKKQEEAKKKFEEMMKNFKPTGGAAPGQEGKPHEDNPANRLKTAELQLQQFEKNKHNKELLEKLGYTEAEYDRFLKGYRDMVGRQRDEVEKQAVGAAPKPAGPADLKVGEGSGNKKLETRSDGTNSGSGSGTPGTAPPGYSEAQRKFAEEAAKLRKSQEKK